MKYRHYGLEEFHTDCKTIARQLVDAEYFPDVWVALDRGGVVAAATIRREFQNLVLRHRGHLYIKHKDQSWLDVIKIGTPQRKYLLIDDIVDFGLQYRKSVDAFDRAKETIINEGYQPEQFPRTKHAALIWNLSNKCRVRADFYGQTIDKEKNPEDNAWIKFWWEGE